MPLEILYHPEVKKDLAKIDARKKTRIKVAIENWLKVAPHQYGEPIRGTLKGYWKLRVGDYRIVFKVKRRALIA